jgi:hypothetical protein
MLNVKINLRKMVVIATSLAVMNTTALAQERDNTVTQTKNVTTNSTLYTVRMQEPKNGLWIEYMYSPNIAFSQGLLDSLKDMFSASYKTLLPSISNEIAAKFFAYQSNGITVTQDQINTLDWTNFLNLIGNIVPGTAASLAVLNNTTGSFVNISQNQSIINSYVKTTSYSFLISTTTETEFAYVNAVLTPITTTVFHYDNVDIKTLTLSKTVLETVIDNNNIAATITGGQLQLNWSTLTENNMNRFEIEASADGVNNFVKIGEVKTKAANGISNATLQYSFSKDIAGITSLLSISLFALVIGFTRRKRFAKWLLAIGVVVLLANAACSKTEAPAKSGDIFIRIKQIDTNGNFQYSKTMQIISNS